MKRKSFKNKWKRLKLLLDESDFQFFHEVVHMGEEIRRRSFCSMKEYNPRYMGYWFPQGNCHVNVVFALFLLEKYDHPEKYKIITSDAHSAIIDTQNNIIYDPTFDWINTDSETMMKMLEGFKIQTMGEYLSE